MTDELTGIPNIRYLKMLLKADLLMAKRDKSRNFSVIMPDIDHFKKLNDIYGHKTGDVVLKQVALLLKETIHASDVVARYGGEEWIFLLRAAKLDNAVKVAEKIRTRIENISIANPYAKTGKDVFFKTTLSLGVVHFRVGDDEHSTIRRADETLYSAKNRGRNRVESKEEAEDENFS